MTKQIMVGNVAIGAGAQVSVQSMTNTKTENIEATCAQISRLEQVGCDIVRVAVPNIEAAKAIAVIKERVSVPIVADIHFDYKLALECVAAGADKIRINPGNIGAPDRIKAVANACSEKNIPIRIGVNGGSLEKDIEEKYSGITAEAMVESAKRHIDLLNRFDFDDICVSLKASDVKLTVDTYRLMSERYSYPLHIGITEAGGGQIGLLRSAIGIGSLLMDGIGDTIRVSLTDDPEEEVKAGFSILKACNIRNNGVRIISCPSCGRCDYDLIGATKSVERRLEKCTRNITVAVMGCVVNGPGEARYADYGMAGGKTQGIIFKNGNIVFKAPNTELEDRLIELIEEDDKIEQ